MSGSSQTPYSLLSNQRRSGEQRPSNKRGPSGGWSRLKTPPIDSLEVYGYPSKGETKLNDPKAQESLYNKIVERYMKFCASSSSGDELDKQFASLSFNSTSPLPTANPPTPPPSRASRSGSNASNAPPSHSVELATILTALRKIREAIVATDRRDEFAQRVYIFNIHAAILCKEWESYAPALISLLTKIHSQSPLPAPELHEFVGFWILDLACRQSDIMAAYTVKKQFKYEDRRVGLVLKALAHDDWVLFWKMRRAVDGYQRRIMEFADTTMRLHALKCLGRSYMTADRAYVERCTDRKWVDLVKDGVGWEITEGEKIVIRRPKVK
ncbi:hypothetical protein BU16DRAFT_478500 [Lophium mytilinum]|uniref:CSN8/PSMD8/EIF3K domain-containing protein n=1 Tax=Lophium mytilinum TaxID=390894 RepID=A0A6A6R791_9PEZI|nr:hypothetical protein BU16DRAFT_478500 [Lophium mytilinum]